MDSLESEDEVRDQREIQDDNIAVDLFCEDLLLTSRLLNNPLRKKADQLFDDRFELFWLFGNQINQFSWKQPINAMYHVETELTLVNVREIESESYQQWLEDGIGISQI